MAAIFDFNGSGRLGGEEICTKRAVDSQKEGEGWRWGRGEGEDLECLLSYGSQL